MADADVLELVRQDRLLDAARLSQSRGDARAASQLFERACDWASAAVEALRCADHARALDLAIRAGDEALGQDAARQVAADPARAAAAAEQLTRRGQDRWAAHVLESAGRALDAARAWERAGDAVRSAAQFERAHEPAQAARALESVLRRDPPAADAPRVAVALGLLLVRFAKDEAAVRALQRVPASAPERRDALGPMIAALTRLGLARAAAEAATELAAFEAPAGAMAPAQSIDPRYEIVRQVASSPRAQVLECIDRERGGERVAIKRFAAAPRDRAGDAAAGALAHFEAESHALARVHHPAIVAVRDVLPDVPAIVLGWMGGGSLDAMLARAPTGRLGPARAVEIACTVLDGLAAAHRLGVLHRAVKPTNVLFDDDGAARLSDFGAARLADATATVTAGDDGGTAFLGPEQRQGSELTARSDVFAVGVLLGVMLGGASAAGALAEPSAAHRGLDARHDDAVARLRAADPLARPADALEARALLQSLPWPADVDLHAPGAQTATAPGAPASTRDADAERLQVGPDGRAVDAWTGRAIEVVPLTDATLARARAFANADHAALQPVLRIDRAARLIWLAAAAAVLERAPTASEAKRIDAAFGALRAVSDGARVERLPDAETRILVDAAGNVLVGFALPDHLSSTIA